MTKRTLILLVVLVVVIAAAAVLYIVDPFKPQAEQVSAVPTNVEATALPTSAPTDLALEASSATPGEVIEPTAALTTALESTAVVEAAGEATVEVVATTEVTATAETETPVESTEVISETVAEAEAPTASQAESATEVTAPTLLTPADGATGSLIKLTWSWTAELGEDEWYEVQIWPDQADAQPSVFGWQQTSELSLTSAHLMPGTYRWRVVVVLGHDTSRGEELSGYSPEWTFTITRPSTKATMSVTPPVVSTRTPTPVPVTDLNTLAVVEGETVELARVPAVRYLIGSARSDAKRDADEWPQRAVSLDEYYIAKTEVTVKEFRAFVEATNYEADPRSLEDEDDQPVRYVSWTDAVAFCAWASEVTGRDVHLPTEAQWEQAARGTDGRIYPWGNTAPDDTLCNYDNNVGTTADVASYSPDGDSYYGCADMAGNVWEWVQDYYVANSYLTMASKNPTGPSTGTSRVVRGGGWSDAASDVRAATRKGIRPDARLENQGFRVCVTSTSPTPTPTATWIYRRPTPRATPTITGMPTIVEPTVPQPTITIAEPSATPTTVQPTPTETLMPTPTFTEVPTPTYTEVPTPTYTPVPTMPTPTNTPEGYVPPVYPTETPGGGTYD